MTTNGDNETAGQEGRRTRAVPELLRMAGDIITKLSTLSEPKRAYVLEIVDGHFEVEKLDALERSQQTEAPAGEEALDFQIGSKGSAGIPVSQLPGEGRGAAAGQGE